MPQRRARVAPPNPPLTEPPNDGTQTDLATATIAVFNPDFESLNLWQKIARITGMIGGVEKRGYNAFHKYHYTLESDLVTAVRQYLAAAGIIIIPNAHLATREGELTTVYIEYTVTDGKEQFSFQMPGTGSDRGDKGLYKAITGSQKYALMKLFKIETGDHPEGDTRGDERAAVASAPQRETRVTAGSRAGVRRGGHTETASPIQVRRISELVRELGLERPEIVRRFNATLGTELKLPDDEAQQGKAITEFVQGLTTEQAGQLVVSLTEEVNEREAGREAAADANEEAAFERLSDAADRAGYPYG